MPETTKTEGKVLAIISFPGIPLSQRNDELFKWSFFYIYNGYLSHLKGNESYSTIFTKKKKSIENPGGPVLGFRTSTAEGPGSISCQELRDPKLCTVWQG